MRSEFRASSPRIGRLELLGWILAVLEKTSR